MYQQTLQIYSRRSWEDYVVEVVNDAEDEANNPSFKLSSPTRKDILNWVHWGHVFLQESKVMIQRFFEVCRKTLTNPGFVIMANIEVDGDHTDGEMFKGVC